MEQQGIGAGPEPRQAAFARPGQNAAAGRPSAGRARLTAIDRDWNCPWPLDRQRHYRVLADLADTVADGVLPDVAPGVIVDGDDIGLWLQQQKQPAAWARLLPEQQDRRVQHDEARVYRFRTAAVPPGAIAAPEPRGHQVSPVPGTYRRPPLLYSS